MYNKTSKLNTFSQKPKHALWNLALPVMLGMGIQTLYSITDMYFIGRLDNDAMAAVAFNMPLFFIVLGLTMGLGTGVTSTIANFIGLKKKKDADNSAGHAIVLGILISITLTPMALIYGKTILVLFGATNEILQMSWIYLKLICFGLPFMVLSAFFRSILVGEGDTKFPMLVAGSGTILNIILDPIFIFTLNMGVSGAALATTISQIIVFIIFIFLLLVKKRSYITFSLNNFNPSVLIFKKIINVGLPASMSMIIMALGQLIFNKILSSFSIEAVAAYQIGGRIDMLIFLPIMSIAYALTTLVGMFNGAKLYKQLNFIINYGLRISFLLTASISITVYIFAPFLIKNFSNDVYTVDTAITYLRMMTLIYPFVAIAMPCGRILQGFGLGMPVLIITLIRVLLISCPLAIFFVFVQNKSIEWIWYSMMISAIVSFIVAVLWIAYIKKLYLK